MKSNKKYVSYYCIICFDMNIKYRIRRRKGSQETQYYVDYKRFKDGDNLDNIEWMGGF